MSGFSSLPIPPSQNRRGDIAERPIRDVPRETNRSADQRPGSTFDKLNNRDRLQSQRAESPDRASVVNARRQLEDESVSHSTRRALHTFAENTPSPEQQLGIELAGIDTFA